MMQAADLRGGRRRGQSLLSERCVLACLDHVIILSERLLGLLSHRLKKPPPLASFRRLRTYRYTKIVNLASDLLRDYKRQLASARREI